MANSETRANVSIGITRPLTNTGSRPNSSMSKPDGCLTGIIFVKAQSKKPRLMIHGRSLFMRSKAGFFSFWFQAEEILDQVVYFGVLNGPSPARHVEWRRRALRVERINLMLAVEDAVLQFVFGVAIRHVD